MARAPNEKTKEAETLYRKGFKLVDIARELDLPEGTVRRWKCTYKWDNERSDKKANVRKKTGAPKGNKNAVGHGAPKGNKNAEKHGLFTKWLPEETAEIIGTVASEDPIELLWQNIILQQSVIIRAQKIMHVEGKDEIIKEVIKTKEKSKERQTEKTSTSETESEIEYAFQFAWDRQATFMTALSRAQNTLLRMIEQYIELVNKNWDLATEEQKARIAVLKKQAEDKGNIDKEITITLAPELEGWAE